MAMEQYSKLSLEFDKVTGAMKLANQESVSLQKQFRYLKQELTLGTYTEAQFAQIRKAVQETEIGLKQTQLRGQDLFAQIGSLGGPIGEMSNRLDRALKLFVAISEMSFDEIKNQFTNIGKILTGNYKTISDTIDVAQTGGRAPGVRESTGNAGEAGNVAQVAAAGASALAAKQSADAVKTIQATQQLIKTTKDYEDELGKLSDGIAKNIKFVEIRGDVISASNKQINTSIAYQKQLEAVTEKEALAVQEAARAYRYYLLENKNALEAAALLEEQFQDVTFAVKDGAIFIGVHDLALRQLTDAENAAIISGKKLIITQEGLIAVETEATVATKGLSAVTAAYGFVVKAVSAFIQGTFLTSIRVADIAAKGLTLTMTALSAVIGGLFIGGQVIGPLLEWATGFAKTAAEAENLKVEIEGIKKILDLDLADIKRRSAEETAVMKTKNATSAQLRKKDLDDTKETFNAITLALQDARQKQAIAQQKSEEYGGLFGISSEAAEQQAENVKKAGELVLTLEQKQKDEANAINVKGNKNIEETTKEGINNRIKAIDAEIEQQIESRQTESKELLRLYKERNGLVDYLDKDHTLTTIEEAERRRIQKKKINDAVIEDNVRVIQAEIDAQQRIVDEVGKGTEEQFTARREIAQQMFNKEMEEAKKDEKTRLNNEKNARTKFYKESRQIDIDELNAKEELAQHYLNGESENTKQFFQLERQLENAAYAKQQEIAKGNYDVLEALRLEHLKKMEAIDAKEFENRAQMLDRQSKTEFQDKKNKDDYTIASLFDKNNVLRTINEKAYQDQVESENANYEAQKLRAGTNKEQLEQVELEHLQVLRDLGAQKIETEQQVNLMIEQLGVQFGTTLSNIGNMLLQDAQGRDEKKFKAAKKMAVAGIGIEKAAAIASIWTNNYIANAKARATFWATGGQPFVTINTISAILNTAATIAAAAQAMSAINGQDFQSPEKGSGRHYASGGMIDGPRHSNGGVPIEAEGGEAVMTRGAVTAFAPLLSMLNVAGGGTSFSQGAVGQAGYDNPTRDGQQFQQAQITKTYVVEQELTTMQQRQARLKNLSTL